MENTNTVSLLGVLVLVVVLVVLVQGTVRRTDKTQVMKDTESGC